MQQNEVKPITGVRVVHARYAAMLPKWQRMRDVIAGQDAVKAKTVAYLPALSDQDEPGYRNYLKRARFFNATSRTVDGLGGMIMRIAPTRTVPAAIEAYLADITMSGVPVDALAETLLEEAISIGRIGVLVDHPTVSVEPGAPALTIAAAETMGLRPRTAVYKAESIRNWRTGNVANATILTMVVLEESAALDEQADEFNVATETRYRVLDLFNGQYRQRVFRINDKGEDEQVGADAYPLMNGRPLDRIPFFIMGTDDLSPDVDDPPLIDLADTNLSHYAVTADYERGCHLVATPTPVVSGHTMSSPTDKLLIGSESAWVFPQPDAKAYFLEYSGAGMGSLRDNLSDKKAEMATLGARMLSSDMRSAETAEGAAIDNAGETSMLAAVAKCVSAGMEQVLTVFARWAGAPGTIRYQLNRQFMPTPMSPQKLAALMASWQQGGISHQTLFDNLQRGEVIAPDVTFADEQARIDSAPPLALVPPVAAPAEEGAL